MKLTTATHPTDRTVGYPTYIADETPERDAVIASLASDASHIKDVQMELLDVTDPLHGSRERVMATFTGLRELPDSVWCEVWLNARRSAGVQKLHGYMRFDSSSPRVELWVEP